MDITINADDIEVHCPFAWDWQKKEHLIETPEDWPCSCDFRGGLTLQEQLDWLTRQATGEERI